MYISQRLSNKASKRFDTANDNEFSDTLALDRSVPAALAVCAYPTKKILKEQPGQGYSINSSLERPIPSPEAERVETVTDLFDAGEEYSCVTYTRADGNTVKRIVNPEPCHDDADEANPFCLQPYAVAPTTQDVLDRPSILGPEPLAPATPKHSRPPKQDFLASREASRSEVYSQEELRDHSPSGSAIVLSEVQCLALTHEQCRESQEIVDPDDLRQKKSWEFDS